MMSRSDQKRGLLHDDDYIPSSQDTINNNYLRSLSTASDNKFLTDEDSHRKHSSSFSASNIENSAYLTTFLLLNTMIGSGILNQPYVFSKSGILGGLFGFLIASIATWSGLLCLTAAGLKSNVLEYSGLATYAFGEIGEKLVDISIICLTFGSQLGYILIVGSTLSDLLISWGCDDDVCNIYLVTIISVGCFVTPVCLFRHFGHLAYLSLFSIATIVAVLCLVMIGGPIKHHVENINNDYKIFDILGMIKSIGSIVFSLSCSSANFQAFITTEKSSQNMDSWTKITASAVFIGASMCAVMGLTGYLSFSDETESEILDNFSQHGFDFFKIMVVLHLILYIPVNFVIMRYSLVKITVQKKSEELETHTHTMLSISLLAFVTGIVLGLLGLGLASGEAFSLILNITGGIGGSLATLILPASIYLKVNGIEGPLYNRARILFALGFFVMFAVVIVTIITMF